MTTYSDKLKDPRWQEKRLSILKRDDYECKRCYSLPDNPEVHHKIYHPDREPWDHEDDELVTLCRGCHEFVGTRFIDEEIHNPWLTYERLKRQIPEDLNPHEYSRAIIHVCQKINL